MDEEIIADFKQFMVATIRQELTDVRSDIARLDGRVESLDLKVDKLDKKIDDRIDEVLAAVADSTDSRFEVIEQDVSSIQARVITLETAK